MTDDRWSGLEIDEEPLGDPLVDREDAADADMPEMAYSATRLEAGRCHFQFYAQYIAKLPTIQHRILTMGTFHHAVLERYVRKCVQARVSGDPLLATQALEEVWLAMPTIPASAYPEAFEAAHWFAMNYEVPWDQIVDVELELAVDAQWRPCGWKDPQVRRRGRIDALQVKGAMAVIVDWKSGRAVPTEKEMAKALAPKMYAALEHAHNPLLREVTVAFHYTRFNIRRAIRFEPNDVARAREDVERAEARLDALLVNRDDPAAWPPIPGPYCGTCPFVHVCPARDAVQRAGFMVRTPAQAELAAREILYLEARLRERRDAMKEYVERAGRVSVSGAVFDYWKQAQWKVDMKKLEAACRKHGVPFAEVVRADRRLVDRIGRTAKSFLEDAAAAMEDVGQTRFRWKREGEQ